MSNLASNGKVKTKVSMGMQVIRAADGSVEDYGEQYSHVVELSYEDAVEMLGKDKADELFRGAKGVIDDG
jgi:hypothetical protein